MPIIQVRDLISTGTGAGAIDQASSVIQHLDLDSGHLFDASGNTIAKLEARDDYSSQLLSAYGRDYQLEVSARAIAGFNSGVARQLLAARSYGVDTPTLLADLGPSDVHIPGAMNNYASGYANFTPMADIIAPPLLVAKDTNYFFEFQKEDAFGRAIPQQAAAGGQVGEIAPRLTGSSSYKVVARALAGFVPTEVEANSDAPLKIKQAYMRRIINAMMLEREIRVAALLRSSNNWNLATTIPSGSQWNGGASSDPVKDLHTVLDGSFGEVTGTMLAGKTYRGFTRNTAVRGYYGFNGSLDGIPSQEKLQATLRLPPFYVNEMRYIDSTGALQFVWGNDAVMFRNPPENPPTSQEDVATAYTFRWATPPSPDGTASGGFVVRQFFLQDRGPQGGTKIICANYDAEKMTSKWIGNLLINAYQ